MCIHAALSHTEESILCLQSRFPRAIQKPVARMRQKKNVLSHFHLAIVYQARIRTQVYPPSFAYIIAETMTLGLPRAYAALVAIVINVNAFGMFLSE